MSSTLPDCGPLLAWYHKNRRDLPWRRTRDPYRIWVSEVMLQQTRVEAAIPYYERFLAAVPDIASLAAIPEPQLLKLWEGLGYYSRVRNMQRAARAIVESGGRFPDTYEEIRNLPGVGDYIAGAVASFAFGLPVPALDGNVLRVTARLLGCDGDVTRYPVRKKLVDAVADAMPKDASAADFNQAMIELGALVCLPHVTPRCEDCPFAADCVARREGRQAELPVRSKARPRRHEQHTVLILRDGDLVAFRRRADTGLLAGLYEPIRIPGHLTEPQVFDLLESAGCTPLRIAPLGPAKHVFSHIEWHLVGYEVELPEGTAGNCPDGILFAPRDAVDRAIAIPSAYRAYKPFI